VFPQNSVLVAYKGKILLKSPDNLNISQNVWGFIGEEKSWTTAVSENVLKEVRLITKLNLDTINKIPLTDTDNNSHIFYIKLTDGNVNSIVRREGQRLEFYSLNEVDNLPLSNSAGHILTKFRDELKELLSD
jgi:hypothetical protein